MYEKVNMMTDAARQGDIQLQDREDDMRFLRLEVQDLKRAIKLLRDRLPVKTALEKDLIKTRMELYAVQTGVMRREKLLEAPQHSYNGDAAVNSGGGESGREWRVVMATQPPTMPELEAKVVTLSNRLAAKEARELELDLVLQETLRLHARAEKQQAARRQAAAPSITGINDAQNRLAELTRKTMAIVSELSMYQGTCIKQQQQVHEMRLTLEESKARLERGDPPSEDALKNWERELRRLEQVELRREMDALGIASAAVTQGTTAGGSQLPNGTTTWAEQRPVAYIPDVEDALPKARPFGKDAPFKPPNPSANLKFYRGPATLVTATK